MQYAALGWVLRHNLSVAWNLKRFNGFLDNSEEIMQLNWNIITMRSF